jgi:phosphate transport system substrate-binding protein
MGKRVLTVLLTVMSCLGAGSVIAETLEIPGTGSCEVVLKEMAAIFNAQRPGREVIIPPSIGSKGGIRSVIKKQNLIARVGRPLEGEETQYGLQYLVFARDLIVFAAGAKVSIRSLTTVQLSDIFGGKIDNWQELGGNKASIRVLIRQPGETSMGIIQQRIKPFQQLTFTDRSRVLYHDCEMVEMLKKYETAIGFLTLSSIFATPNIKPLAIDHIRPTAENLMAGKYELGCEYALVYVENGLNELAKKFIDFIYSDAGKQVLKRYGLIPVGRR